MNTFSDFSRLAWRAIRRNKKSRSTKAVEGEYTNTWDAVREKLEKSKTLEEWITDGEIEGYYNIDGKFIKKKFNSQLFYRNILHKGLENFPEVKSVAEFGCGVGRNLIDLHLKYPHLTLYGYELCQPGVEIANAAAKKFNLPITYHQLDYVNWIPSDISIPNIDVGFTCFSLEQVPRENLKGLQNILSRVGLGTFHLEPVVENYPWTIKGIIGKIDHYKADYLQNFEKNAKKAAGKENIKKYVYNTAHNPLMYPSLYVIKKKK